MHGGFWGHRPPPFGGGKFGGRGGLLQPCLLLILSEGDQHGYSLMDELVKRKFVQGDVDVGNLYRTLRRLEAEGLVTSRWSEEGAGPNRRIYQITPRGKQFVQFMAGVLEQRTWLINRFLDEFRRVFKVEGAIPTADIPGSNADEDLL
jgi:PadR family transcriptional regulator, regulatory protein PadR